MRNFRPIGHGSRYDRPDNIADDYIVALTPAEHAELVVQRLASECTWRDCHRPRFYDMPICQGHAQIVYVRVLGARKALREKLPTNLPVDPDPVVYYLIIGPTTVKIGTTIDLRQRVMNMRTDLQYVVAVEWGGRRLERQRHLEFADERHGRREDFLLSNRLKAHIEALQPQRDEIVALASRPGGYRPVSQAQS